MARTMSQMSDLIPGKRCATLSFDPARTLTPCLYRPGTGTPSAAHPVGGRTSDAISPSSLRARRTLVPPPSLATSLTPVHHRDRGTQQSLLACSDSGGVRGHGPHAKCVGRHPRALLGQFRPRRGWVCLCLWGGRRLTLCALYAVGSWNVTKQLQHLVPSSHTPLASVRASLCAYISLHGQSVSSVF